MGEKDFIACFFFDTPLEQLQKYQPERRAASDFDNFWKSTIASPRQHPIVANFTPADYKLRALESYDVTFSGYGGQPIKGWLNLPAHRDANAKLPCLVEFLGYGGGRGFPTDWLMWASAGYANLVMDTR